MKAFKLFTKRKDGTIGPLFINRKLRLRFGEWFNAESHPTKGFAYRPGWHCTLAPVAPHLSEKGRVWCEVEIEDYKFYDRPFNQGGTWVLANKLKINNIYNGREI